MFQGTAEKILEAAEKFPTEIALRLPLSRGVCEEHYKYESLTKKINLLVL